MFKLPTGATAARHPRYVSPVSGKSAGVSPWITHHRLNPSKHHPTESSKSPSVNSHNGGLGSGRASGPCAFLCRCAIANRY